MFKHILLPTDGSELSESTARNGIALAKLVGAKVTGLCSRRSGDREHSSVSHGSRCAESAASEPYEPPPLQLILDEGSVASPAHAGADRLLGGMCQVDMCAFGDACARGEGPSSRSARPADAATAPDAPFCMSAGGRQPHVVARVRCAQAHRGQVHGTGGMLHQCPRAEPS